MTRKTARSPDVQTEIREPIDLSKNLPFDHIVEKHKHEYDFCIINDAKGAIQRHLMAGWQVWDKSQIFNDEFSQKTQANRVRDGYASVPCGIAGDGQPTSAYLLYAPKGHAQRIIDARHAENRERKKAYGGTAEQRAAASVGQVNTYNPAGFGDGMKNLPNTTS